MTDLPENGPTTEGRGWLLMLLVAICVIDIMALPMLFGLTIWVGEWSLVELCVDMLVVTPNFLFAIPILFQLLRPEVEGPKKIVRLMGLCLIANFLVYLVNYYMYSTNLVTATPHPIAASVIYFLVWSTYFSQSSNVHRYFRIEDPAMDQRALLHLSEARVEPKTRSEVWRVACLSQWLVTMILVFICLRFLKYQIGADLEGVVTLLGLFFLLPPAVIAGMLAAKFYPKVWAILIGVIAVLPLINLIVAAILTRKAKNLCEVFGVKLGYGGAGVGTSLNPEHKFLP